MHLSDVVWGRKVADCIKVLFAWTHTVVCDLEFCKLYFVRCEDEHGGVECYTMLPTDVKPVDCLVEAAADVICPQQGVVDTFCFVGNVGDNLVKPSGVAIT